MLCGLYLNKAFFFKSQDSVTEWNCKIKQRNELKDSLKSCSAIHYVCANEQGT